jgi:DNA-binding CsgD family transcriptional regulator
MFLGAAILNSMENAHSGTVPSRSSETEPKNNISVTSLPSCDSVPLLGDQGVTSRDVLIALTFGLELVRNGAMLVASEGRCHLANRAALAILEKKDGLSLSRTGLVADRAADTRLLQRLLQEAVTAPELGEPKGSPLTLPRRSTPSALIVRVVPGPGLNCWPGAQNGAALLTLYDQDLGLEVDESVLSKLYGLTRGEAALAAHLLRGKSIEEAAELLFVSPHTARTHLKRIFMKTDTHRQTELVVRIFSSVL